MKEFEFKKIDAFATGKSEGNPAGYIHLKQESDIHDKDMLRIAKELRTFVNEVGYLWQISQDKFGIKYYCAEREVDFCGHATIAIMYDLIKNSPEFSKKERLFLKTNRGDELVVENMVEKEDSVFILSPKPEFKDININLDIIAEKLGIDLDSIDGNYPVSVVNAGLTTLIVPIKDLNTILEITPDLEELKEFCHGSGIDIIEVFTNETSDRTNDFRTRVFAATFGYLEDPATGSGNSAFGYYLMANNYWNKASLTIEQNSFMDEFNIVKLRKKVDKEGNDRVIFGGGAVTRVVGKYLLQP